MIWRTIVLTVVLSAGTAGAIPRGDCPAGTSWNIAAGACVKKKAAPQLSPQAKFERASDDLEGRGKTPDAKRGLALLEQTCTTDNHAASCRLLGFLYVRGRAPVTKDDAKAADYFAKACNLKDLDACADVGDLAVRTGDFEKARVAFQHGCELGNAIACVRDGDLIDRGLGGPKDPANALPIFKKALDKLSPICAQNGWDGGGACYQVGWMHENGKGTSKDLGKALAAFRAGCTAGHGEACMGLGRALDAGYGGSKDEDGANTAYDRACTDFDNGDACQKLGERLGMAKKDLPKAFKLSERGCELDPKWCGTLAEFYRLGFGIPAKDQVKATENYKKACDNGQVGWCENYGERAHDGIGMAKDVQAGIAALERSCNGGWYPACGTAARYLTQEKADDRAVATATKGCDNEDGESCFRLGLLWENGRGLEKSDSKAVEQYTKGCVQFGSPASCNALANMVNAGAGTTKDLAKATELYKKACEGNDKVLFADACKTWAGRLHEGIGAAKDLKAATKAMLRACEFQVEGACSQVSGYNFEAGGSRADIEKTLETLCNDGTVDACLGLADLLISQQAEADRRAGYAKFEAVCKGDSAKQAVGCIRQADMLAAGRGVTKDPAKAEPIYKKQCEDGFVYACNGLGNMFLQNNKAEQALPYYKRACEDGYADGCNGMALLNYLAKGTRWDIVAAVTYFQKSCDLGSLQGCANVGEMYRYGIGVPLDHKKAFALYDKACQIPGSEAGCGSLGHYLATGEGGNPIDKKRAETVLRFSCVTSEFHSPQGCEYLAALIEENHGSATEVARLRSQAFTRATEEAKDNGSYMWVLGDYHRDGMGTVKDPAKALELYTKACETFDPMGCMRAATTLRQSKNKDDAQKAHSYFERACAAGITEGCAGLKAKGPTPAHGCCSGQVAPDAETGALLALVGLVVFRRRRRAGATPARRA